MDDHKSAPTPYQQGRETFLALMLLALFGGGGVLFLIVATGGFFFYVLTGALALGLMAGLQYILWGRGFSEEITREREEYELEREAEEQESARRPWERKF